MSDLVQLVELDLHHGGNVGAWPVQARLGPVKTEIAGAEIDLGVVGGIPDAGQLVLEFAKRDGLRFHGALPVGPVVGGTTIVPRGWAPPFSSRFSSQQLLHPPGGALAALTGGRSFLRFSADAWRELVRQCPSESVP